MFREESPENRWEKKKLEVLKKIKYENSKLIHIAAWVSWFTTKVSAINLIITWK